MVCTVNGEWLTGTAKCEDVLKLYVVDKQCILPDSHSDCETHKALCPGCEEGQHGCASYESTVALAFSILVTVYKDNYIVSLNDK